MPVTVQPDGLAFMWSR